MSLFKIVVFFSLFPLYGCMIYVSIIWKIKTYYFLFYSMIYRKVHIISNRQNHSELVINNDNWKDISENTLNSNRSFYDFRYPLKIIS